MINREGKSPIDYARKAKPSRSSGGAGNDLGRDLEAVLRREAERHLEQVHVRVHAACLGWGEGWVGLGWGEGEGRVG